MTTKSEKSTKKPTFRLPGYVYYCRAHYPTKEKVVNGTKFEPAYGGDLVITKDVINQTLKEHNVNRQTMKNDEGLSVFKEFKDHPGQAVYHFSQKAMIKDQPAEAPFVRDSKGNPVPKSTLIGDGSKVIVTCNLYYNKYQKCMQLGFKGIEIIDLVEVENTTETVDFADAEDTKGSYTSDIIAFDDDDVEAPFDD